MTRGQLNRTIYGVIVLLAVLSVVIVLINNVRNSSDDLQPDICGAFPNFRCFPDKSCAPGWTLAMQNYACTDEEKPSCCYLEDPDEYYPEGTLLLTLRGAHEATFRVYEIDRLGISKLDLQSVWAEEGFEAEFLLGGPNNQGDFAVLLEDGYDPYMEFFRGGLSAFGIPRDIDISLQYKPPSVENLQQFFFYLGKLKLNGVTGHYLSLFEGVELKDGPPERFSAARASKLTGLLQINTPFTAQDLARKLKQQLVPRPGDDAASAALTLEVEEAQWVASMKHFQRTTVFGPFSLPISPHLESTWAKRREKQ